VTAIRAGFERDQRSIADQSIPTARARQAISRQAREVGERLAPLGYDAAANSPEQLAEHVKVELARYGRLIRAIGFCDKAGPE